MANGGYSCPFDDNKTRSEGRHATIRLPSGAGKVVVDDVSITASQSVCASAARRF